MLDSNIFIELNFLFSFTRYSNFSQLCQENPKYSMPSNPIYKKIGGQNKISGSERLLQIYSIVLENHICLNENVDP